VTTEPSFHYLCRTSSCKGRMLCMMYPLHYCVICRRTLCGKGSRCLLLEVKYKDALKTVTDKFLNAAHDYWLHGRAMYGQPMQRWVRVTYDIGTFDVCDVCVEEWKVLFVAEAARV